MLAESDTTLDETDQRHLASEPSVRVHLIDFQTTLYVYGGERLADVFDFPAGRETFFMCCKKALCGTCLVEVISGGENLSPPTEKEVETMERLFVTHPRARLACQARVWGHCALKTFKRPEDT